MNHFRNKKLRNRPDRGGPIADQEKDDGGSVNSELSEAAESMFEFAAKDREARKPKITKRAQQVRKQKEYFSRER